MNCQEVKNLISDYLAPHESWIEPAARKALEAHLAQCDSCWEVYEESHQAVEFFLKHCDISGYIPTQTHLNDQNGEIRRTPKFSWAPQTTARVASTAAVILICLGIGWAWLSNNNSHNHEIVQRIRSQNQAVIPEIVVTENGEVISALISISTGEGMRELLINNRHRLAINQKTRLSISPLLENRKQGCLISLHTGQILAEVSHDGKPFEVHTANSRSVITGTTFDVKVQGQSTTLIVSEGTVRFESDKGSREVMADQRSMVIAGDFPSIPESCRADQLMSWTEGRKSLFLSNDLTAWQEMDKLLEERPLPIPFPGQPLELDSMNYIKFIEDKRDWSRKQFPSISRFLDALVREMNSRLSIQEAESLPSHHRLLLESGDLHRIVYPVGPIFADPSRLMGVAQACGFYTPRLIQAVPNMASYSQKQRTLQGVAALEMWLSDCRMLQRTSDCRGGFEILWKNTWAMGDYLETSRALLWLGIQTGMLDVPDDHKTNILDLLREQVTAAYTCKEMAWHFLFSQHQDSSGRDDPYWAKLKRLTGTIEEVIEREKQLDVDGFRTSDLYYN